MIGLLWGLLLRVLPIERILPGGGQKEVTKDELNRASSVSVRRSHNNDFYKRQSVFDKKASVIEDRSLRMSQGR